MNKNLEDRQKYLFTYIQIVLNKFQTCLKKRLRIYKELIFHKKAINTKRYFLLYE